MLVCFNFFGKKKHPEQEKDMNHVLPFDILLCIAQFGSFREAVQWALTCRQMKKRIDRLYEVIDEVDVNYTYSEQLQCRRPRAIGKFVSLCLRSQDEPIVRSPNFQISIWKDVKFIRTSLYCAFGFNDMQLPPKLHTLKFGTRFNRPVDRLMLPESLKCLVFGDGFNQPISGLRFPAHLESITFGQCFNQPIEQVKWPQGLKQLFFARDFNQPVEQVQFPPELEVLSFGFSFNQPVNNLVLPTNLQRLVFGFVFNQPVDKLRLPENLQELIFGPYKFTRSEPSFDLPRGLKKLSLENGFHRSS